MKALKKEIRDRKMEISLAMRSKTLVSMMSSFCPMTGTDQNRASVAAAESHSQSAVGIVRRDTRRAAFLLSGGPTIALGEKSQEI